MIQSSQLEKGGARGVHHPPSIAQKGKNSKIAEQKKLQECVV